MAAFNRLTEATYEVHETVKVDTQDNEDHTFCGIMFPIKCKELLPVDHISIRSLAVRGQLGPITVWVSKEEKPNNNNNRNRATTIFRLSPSHWTKVYEAVHLPSQDTYSSLVLDKPIILKPGQVRAIYIHSTLPGDQAIVYDNASFYLPRRGLHPFGGAGRSQTTRRPRYEDAMISIYTGRAHVSNTPFGSMPIWGWGNSWRDHREFVGQLEYGAVYQLWNPETQAQFGPQFRSALFNLKLCQTRWESPMSRLPDECIYYILNMCRWDWFSDTRQTMEFQQQQQKQLQLLQKQQLEEQQKAERQRQEQLEEQQQQQHQQQQPTPPAAAAAAAIVSEGSSNGVGGQMGSCCAATKSHTTCTGGAYHDGNANESNEDDSNEHYEDALEEQADTNDHDNDNDNDVEIMDDEVELDDDEDDEDSNDDVDVDEVGFDEDGDDDDDDDDDDEDDDDDDWERANGYRADHNVFRFVDPEREEEESQNNEDEDGSGTARQAWIRRQFERIHVLRALAREQDDDEDVVDMHLAF